MIVRKSLSFGDSYEFTKITTPFAYELSLSGRYRIVVWKDGGVLFFHEYARYTGEEIYNEYAYDLLMSVLNNLSKDIPIGFAQGFSGIGWGIQYLSSNRLLEADSEEIFEEIDRKIMEVDPLRMVDLSFDHGLAGIVFYITTRLICAGTDLSFRTQHASYLNQLNDGVERLAEEKVLTDIRKKFHTAYHGTYIIPEEIHIPDFSMERNYR
ncbi:MAG: hypothetical protein LUH15_20955 [Tannerellaceae bacterium]|nr:hypothetical protein [Tannerellaceae bacterium]